MESLREPNAKFDFSKLDLSSPININGGNHFIKYSYDQVPLYIKAPPCSIKQGIVSTSKRIFCDLMFTNENSEFIEFIENLEQYSQKGIFDNRERWFETELEENDIENSFNSCMKIYKSGKFYCLRVSVPRILGKSNLKIYDESEQLVEIENIKENDKVVCALEVQGIKCSARSFQVEIEVKQMLLINQKNIFEKCILLKKRQLPLLETTREICEDDEHNDISNEIIDTSNIIHENIVIDNVADCFSENNEDTEIANEDTEIANEDTEIANENNDSQDADIHVEEISDSLQLNETQEPEECEIPLENFDSDVISLKKKNDVYYEMYRKALNKAKMAKELALSSFLEAKNIKNTYMLDDINDSDLDDSIESE